MSTEFRSPDASVTGYTPTTTELAEIRTWFERYDDLGVKGQVEHMADMADFPINLVTDGSTGQAWTGSWSRAEFLAAMAPMLGEEDATMSFDSTRVPFFLSGSLVVVFTDCLMTAGEQSHRLRYADVLVRKNGSWSFQTMIQSGWADMLTAA